MRINLMEMLTGNLQRLRYVIRFSTCHRVHNESVAEHSFYVAMFTKLIGMESIASGTTPNLDLELAISRALMHDVEEARTGDFPRPFKHSTPGLKESLDRASSEAYRQCFNSIFDNCNLKMELHNQWRYAKTNPQEGSLVEFADYLSVLAYIYQEIRGSNSTMAEHLIEMQKYQHIFETPEFRWPGLAREARKLMEDTLR